MRPEAIEPPRVSCEWLVAWQLEEGLWAKKYEQVGHIPKHPLEWPPWLAWAEGFLGCETLSAKTGKGLGKLE